MARTFKKNLPAKTDEPKKAEKKAEAKKPIATKAKAAKKPTKKESTEDIIVKTLNTGNTIKILEQRNQQLQEIIDAMEGPDRPYKHNKSSEYMIFGRSREQFEELKKIARHLKATTKLPTEAIEKIENFPLKTRDKLILLLEITAP